ncbi:hypothetical protein JCM6882_004876 [Rhodosporidiobolus microsporus]
MAPHSQDSHSGDKKHSLETETPALGLQHAAAQAEANGERPAILLMGEIDQSMGVARIEAINKHLTTPLRACLFFGTFLVPYTYSLDATVRGTLQSYATSSFATHSLLATVNPAYCKIADTFGHIEVILFSIVMYVIGTIVESQLHGIKLFCAGAVLWQFGYSAAILIVEVVISDLTSLRSRLFFSYIPALPFIINTWVSGDITSKTNESIGWSAGIGLWAGIYPFACMWMIVPLFIAQHRARKAGDLDSYLSPYQQLGFSGLCRNLFWELDLLGTILLLAMLILILLPFTFAGGIKTGWEEPYNIAMLVIGVVVCIPAFIVWEKYYAKVPAIPFHLLNNRTVLGCLGMAIGLNTTWYMQGDYLYTVLVVGMNESVKSATQISLLYLFTSVITGAIAGLVVHFILPRLKYIILSGICIWYIAFGLLISYRGGEELHNSVIGAQVILGIAGGLFPYLAQTLLQTAGKHQHTAILLTISLDNYSSAIAGAISGAIWTFLCIAGICLTIPILSFALMVKDPKLSKEQSVLDAKGGPGSKSVVRQV